MIAIVETTFDSGAPRTLRDDEGCLWRVDADAGDGTLAVSLVVDGATMYVDQLQTVGMTPCAIASWRGDDALDVYPVESHGENHTEPSEYLLGHEMMIATPNGWQMKEDDDNDTL